MLQEESAAHMLACEKHPLAEARRERDMFKAECASISAEFGLPPTIRPAEGEITRMRKELKESRAALEGMRAKLERYEEMLDVLRCWFLLPAEPAEGAHRDWARQIEDLFALNTEGVSREPNPAEAERTGGRNTPGSES
jgi:predicted RNase H-like nuclease (RuvC/YqgF family)